MPELIQLGARKSVTRVLLILLIVVATVWSYYVLRWYLGNTMAEYFNTDDNNLELAKVAVSLAPNDPLSHWRLGQVSQQKLPPDQFAPAIAEFEKAVSLSPNDYRFWTALGTARERSGDVAGGELALRQAVALAPSYAYPHWYLGNLLLRSARYDQAFVELQRASEADPQLRPQLFNLAWQVYGNNVESLKSAIGPSSSAKAEFALYLLGQQKPDDALLLWNSMGLDEKRTNRSTGESIVTNLITIQRFHQALSVWNDLAARDSHRATVGRMFDGGFEETISYGPETVFGWQVAAAPQLQIGIDPATSHSGSRSLRLVFEVRSKLDSINVSQLVPVTPNTHYEFECYLKTEKLQSGGTPLIQIVDAATSAVLGTSEPAPSGDNDWKRVGVSLTTGAKAEAITVRIARASCGDTPVCPIFGAVWYDDFSIK